MSYIQALVFNNKLLPSKHATVKPDYATVVFDFENYNSDNFVLKSSEEHQIRSNVGNTTNKRTVLNEQEKIMYAKIHNLLDKNQKTKLENCLKSGKLLELNSNKKNTVLDYLYKIISRPRTKGINAQTIINECINILDNPFIITQIGEDIPEKYLDLCTEFIYNQEEKVRQERKEIAKSSQYMKQKISETGEDKLVKEEEIARIKEQLKNTVAGTCAAASIEFVFASLYPAKFINYIEGLTSEKKEIKKIINCKTADLIDDSIDNFNTKYEIKNGKMVLTLKADDGAYLLAEMQKECQDDDERTTLDILFQSLVYQIATQNTYNSITDTHSSIINDKSSGLNDTEMVYALKILTGKNVFLNIYRYYENYKLVSRVINNDLIERHLNQYLSNGKYILINLNCEDTINTEETHEITIIGKTKNSEGIECYICKDTDIPEAEPILIEKNYILENILDSIVIN